MYDDEDKEWMRLAFLCFARQYDDEKDAIYDDWEERYHGSKSEKRECP